MFWLKKNKNNLNTESPKRILVKHIGNMGDHIFLVGPLLETLSRKYPEAEITLIAAWGYKNSKGKWGERNQDGFCISLMKENPHIDRLVHYHDYNMSLDGDICIEEGKHFPTWNKKYYEQEKNNYDLVAEVDFGLNIFDNPVKKVYESIGLDENYTNYPFYGSESDWKIGTEVARSFVRPRILFLEGLNGESMRGWDPEKTNLLEEKFKNELGIKPIWFGAKFPKEFNGKKLTLRENIAFAGSCDLAIGVMSGPMHFAAAAGVQTICLYGGQPLHRAAPSYFLNPYIKDSKKFHLTIEGPTCDEPCFLKREKPCKNLTKEQQSDSKFESWQKPGNQAIKSCVATIPVETVFSAAKNALRQRNLI